MRPIHLLGLAATAGFVTSAAFAADIHVPSAAPTIQGAINIAEDGDRVLVAPGTYFEVIDFLGKAIVVKSTAGAVVTTIDGAGHEASVVSFKTGEYLDSVFDGFTVTNGSGTTLGGVPHGGGLYARFTSPTVRNCKLIDNHAGAGGGMFVHGSLAQISGCSFIGNTSSDGGLFGGAGLFIQSGNVNVENCVFQDNHAITGSKGGGLNLVLTIHAEIVNCLFVGNTATHGAGIMTQQGEAAITNCTFVENVASNSGGGLRGLGMDTVTTVDNCIFWDNSAIATDEILDQGGAITEVRYTNVQGGWSGAGAFNIDANPGFMDLDAWNLRLSPGSPCIDASDNKAIPREITVDLDGNERISGGTVDMGAYEAQVSGETCPGDIDGSLAVDFIDLLEVLSNWGPCPGCSADLSGDGAVDFSDLLIVLALFGPCP